MSNINVIGIDVGAKGAIAIIDNNYVDVFDTPIMKIDGKTVVDAKKYADLIRTLLKPNTKVLIEQVHSMPKQGVASTFAFGKSFGITIGICAALNAEYEFITPQKWKRHHNLNGLEREEAKSEARSLASILYPDLKNKFELKKHDGRAEAILIARYKLETYNV